MSVIPEIVLQKVIVTGIQSIRKDNRILDSLFKNLTQSELSRVKSFIYNSKFSFNSNYPKQDLAIPALVLVLKNEKESYNFLGNVMGYDNSVFTPDPELLPRVGGTSRFQYNEVYQGPLSVTGTTGSSTIEFSTDISDFIKDLMINPIGSMNAYVSEGAGQGSSFPVLRVREGSIDLGTALDVTLDSTSVIYLVSPNFDGTYGDPSSVFSGSGTYIKYGSIYKNTYYLHIISNHQEEVIYLYTVLKAILLSNTDYLENQGLSCMEISGSDFAPFSEYLPTNAYQRLMVLTFDAPTSFTQEITTFKSLQIEAEPLPSSDSNSIIPIATLSF